MSNSAQHLQEARQAVGQPFATTELHRASQRDELTGFATQQHFSGSLDRLIQRQEFEQVPVTLVLLQLANFYEISSWVGSDEARLLLSRLAGLLQDTVPDNSWLCRCRNHEFALLLVDEGCRHFPDLSEAIHQALRTRVNHLVPPQLTLTCNIGSVRIDGDTPNALVAFARARHDIWQRQLAALTVPPELAHDQGPDLARRLGMALSEDRFRLCFQGTISFRNESLHRYEARMTLIDNDNCLPARLFMDAAVKNALGERLDRRAVELAIETLATDTRPQCQLSVNISQNSLVSSEFFDWLAARLPAGLHARLVLQVSELDILITQHHLGRFCQCARELKLGLGINHFGAVEDPFRYLALIQPDVVKLHRSQLQQLRASPERQQQLADLTCRLHRKGIQIMAPGIEKFSDLPLLWNAGVDLVQGHSLHRPSMTRDCEFVEEIELTLY